MIEVKLTYTTPEGTRSFEIDGEKMSFGRGSEADQRIDDEGLSRIHAIVYRDGSRVWVVDQNSTNGTFVNDIKAAPSGTPLRTGDRLKIGNETVLTVQIVERSEDKPTPAASTPAAPSNLQAVESGPSATSYLPVVIIAGAIFVISISAVFIGYALLGGGTDVAGNRGDDDEPEVTTKRSTPKPGNSGSPVSSPTPADSNANDLPIQPNTNTPAVVPSGKKYLDMSDAEKRQYLEVRAMRIAQIIGNSSSEPIPPAALTTIKSWVDGYARRVTTKQLGGCKFGDNLQTTYERASKNAPFIVRAFNEKGVDPRIGLYLAMIESEHCVCLQSSTGPLGIFQFTYSTAMLHYVPNDGVKKGSSPASPDVRCQPEPSARASASYMKALLGRFGTGPASVPLAIGSYNSGENGLSNNLEKALSSNAGLPRDFWTLIANGDKLSKQFQSENFKYVPKFFGAAIVGENPQDFGLTLQPLSTYSK